MHAGGSAPPLACALALHLGIAFTWFLVQNAIMVGPPEVPESGYMG